MAFNSWLKLLYRVIALYVNDLLNRVVRCIGIVSIDRNRTWRLCTANLLTNLSLRYGGDEVSIIL
nr:unnamed protein product [Callosobruchus analis]CAI5865825.1 unnamed protein product [Callosobruchus analis]